VGTTSEETTDQKQRVIEQQTSTNKNQANEVILEERTTEEVKTAVLTSVEKIPTTNVPTIAYAESTDSVQQDSVSTSNTQVRYLSIISRNVLL